MLLVVVSSALFDFSKENEHFSLCCVFYRQNHVITDVIAFFYLTSRMCLNGDIRSSFHVRTRDLLRFYHQNLVPRVEGQISTVGDCCHK